jgi:segregation and condensation protein B
MSEVELQRCLEAILMVVDEPVSELVLAQIIEAPTEEISAALISLAAKYEAEQRGFELRQVSGGWRYYSHPEMSPLVEKFVLDGQQARLTQAALETLSVIAYRQPVSRARVSAIRGESGAVLYQTTSFFLEKLGLNSISDLPALAPFLPDIDGLDELLSTLTD